LFGIGIYHGEAVVQVLTKSLWIFPDLLPTHEFAHSAGILLLCLLPCGGMYGRVLVQSKRRPCRGTPKFKRGWRYLELMRTQASLRVVLTGKVVGQGGGSKLCRRAVGLGSIALVGRQTGGGVAIGTLATVEELGQVTIVVSASPQCVRAEGDLLAHEMLELALSLDLGAL
jgi:hypothetical protein